MADVKESITQILGIEGCVGAALVDYESGLTLGCEGDPGFDLELAAAGNTEVVRAKKQIRDKLGISDKIEDILISLNSQYHMIRMVGTKLFFYVVLKRDKANLGMARRELAAVEEKLSIERS